MKKGPPAIAPLQGDLFGSRPAAASTPLTPPERESNAPPSDRAAPSTIAPAALPPPTPSREANEDVSGGDAPHAMPSALAALAAQLPPAPMDDSRTALAAPLRASIDDPSPWEAPTGAEAEVRRPTLAGLPAAARPISGPSAHIPLVASSPPPRLVTRPPAGASGTPTRSSRPVLSVGELTRQIKWTLERGFPSVLVRGEVSGFRGPNMRGHLYFSLKDAEACIEAKIWASLASRLKFQLRDGLEVNVEGSVDVFEPQGRYSLIIQRIEPAGEGALALAFQQLKERLMGEGLFGDRRVRPARPIPFLPRRIGVVTSVSGAALRDFLRVLHRRHPKLPVLVCDARVQGDGAADEVVR